MVTVTRSVPSASTIRSSIIARTPTRSSILAALPQIRLPSLVGSPVSIGGLPSAAQILSPTATSIRAAQLAPSTSVGGGAVTAQVAARGSVTVPVPVTVPARPGTIMMGTPSRATAIVTLSPSQLQSVSAMVGLPIEAVASAFTTFVTQMPPSQLPAAALAAAAPAPVTTPATMAMGMGMGMSMGKRVAKGLRRGIGPQGMGPPGQLRMEGMGMDMGRFGRPEDMGRFGGPQDMGMDMGRMEGRREFSFRWSVDAVYLARFVSWLRQQRAIIGGVNVESLESLPFARRRRRIYQDLTG